MNIDENAARIADIIYETNRADRGRLFEKVAGHLRRHRQAYAAGLVATIARAYAISEKREAGK